MRRPLVALALLLPVLAAADDLAPGRVLDQSTAGAVGALLPPEILARYTAGQYRNPIGAWPPGPAWEAAFETASQKNAERLGVSERGTIVERTGGKPAREIYGVPFRIDPADPKAGVKVMWNAYYALWRIGS